MELILKEEWREREKSTAKEMEGLIRLTPKIRLYQAVEALPLKAMRL
jgi:hypothetical protein